MSYPAPTPHAARTQYPRGSALHPHSTNRCLSVQEEAPVAWWFRQHLGRCPQNLGCSYSLACFKPVGSGWPECKGEFLGCTLASECSFSSTLWLGCLQTSTAQSRTLRQHPASVLNLGCSGCTDFPGLVLQEHLSPSPKSGVLFPSSKSFQHHLESESDFGLRGMCEL